MDLYNSKIEDYVKQHLASLESFARAEDQLVLAKSFLGEKEMLHGLYMNNEEDFVLFTDRAVHRIKGDKVRTIEYVGIREVDLPKDPDQRALYIHMRGGDTFLLPIANESDDGLDFVPVRNFLIAIIYSPHFSENPQDIENISSKEDLVEFLEFQRGWDLHRDVTRSLNFGFPEPWQLDLLKIDKELLERPDTWRLLALFLSRSRETVDYSSQAHR